MKPIISNMNDLSDSVEVYESKPASVIIYTIYTVVSIFLMAIIWMSFFKIDNVVKSDGMFRGNSDIYEISSLITGKIEKNYVNNGDYVKEGDILYEIKIDSLSDTIKSYQNNLKNQKDRLQMLSAYEDSLKSNKDIPLKYRDNQYYDEFVNKRNLLFANIKLNNENIIGQYNIYKENINSIQSSIDKYNEKIEKLNKVKQCILNRKNTFDLSESYYYSIVNSYISTYLYNKLQYDNKIEEYEGQISDLKEQIESSKSNVSVNLEELKNPKTTLNQILKNTKNEKKQALTNLERTQLSSIEQTIEGYNDTLLSLNTNLKQAKANLHSVGDKTIGKNIAIFTEIGNILTEKLTVQEKKQECENYLKSYDIQNDNCIIKAGMSGYYNGTTELTHGSFVQEGTSIGNIYPKKETEFFAELYIGNSDIGKIKKGQKVSFEIAAYPSSDYGYFTGKISNISQDISVDKNTSVAYYIVKVNCDKMSLVDKKGDIVTLKNGMACKGKIKISEKTVMTYLLEKINLID